MCLDERIPNKVSELKSENIWLRFGQKTVKNWQNTLYCQFSTVFGPKMGAHVIQFQFWEQIRNPLIKARLLDTKIIGIKKLYFLPPL